MPAEPANTHHPHAGAFNRSHWAPSALDAEVCRAYSGSRQVAQRLGLGAFTAEAWGRLLVREPSHVPSGEPKYKVTAMIGSTTLGTKHKG